MRIDAQFSPASHASKPAASSSDVMAQPAPDHVDTLRWNLSNASERQSLLAAPEDGSGQAGPAIGGILVGGGQGALQASRSAAAGSAQALQSGRGLLSQSEAIFRQYPAQFSQQWQFTNSAVSGKGGATAPLSQFLSNNGIAHNGSTPHAVPAGSVANAAQASAAGVASNHINNHNGAVAENALANRLRAQGYAVQQNAIVQTPLGTRDVDILATKNIGHPTLSEEIRVESKVGQRNLPAHASGSNVRAQALKDAAALSAHNAAAPAAQAQGRALHAAGNAAVDTGERLAGASRVLGVAGKIARPVGVVVSAFEVGSAFKADGNQVGVNTVGKVASIAGGAGGAWAGAAAGAALGSVVPGVGTVIGGIVGGIAGGLLGEAAVSGAFNAVKGWFS